MYVRDKRNTHNILFVKHGDRRPPGRNVDGRIILKLNLKRSLLVVLNLSGS
jgi:hypothetical protein